MTSENPDILCPITVEKKELEMLKIVSIRTLKRGNKKCGNEEVFNLVKDSFDGVGAFIVGSVNETIVHFV